jgi:hypothetical protein
MPPDTLDISEKWCVFVPVIKLFFRILRSQHQLIEGNYAAHNQVARIWLVPGVQRLHRRGKDEPPVLLNAHGLSR